MNDDEELSKSSIINHWHKVLTIESSYVWDMGEKIARREESKRQWNMIYFVFNHINVLMNNDIQ